MTSPISPRGSYEEVNDVTSKLRGTGPSGIWPYLPFSQSFQSTAITLRGNAVECKHVPGGSTSVSSDPGA